MLPKIPDTFILIIIDRFNKPFEQFSFIKEQKSFIYVYFCFLVTLLNAFRPSQTEVSLPCQFASYESIFFKQFSIQGFS